MTPLIALGVIVWLVMGFISAGYDYGWFQHTYPWSDNNTSRWITLLVGPIGLFSTALLFNFKHWRWSASTQEERWEAYHREWPSLEHERFLRDD